MSGYAQSGKDTTAQILVDNFGFTRVAFADALRDSLYALNPFTDVMVTEVGDVSGQNTRPVRVQEIIDQFGWDKAKVTFPEIRSLLQRLGTEVGREILGENIWVEIALRKAAAVNGPVVITDMRFPNEYEAIDMARRTGTRAEAWRIIRPGTKPVNAHPSETALDGHLFDVEIWNGNEIEDLEKIVKGIMESGDGYFTERS